MSDTTDDLNGSAWGDTPESRQETDVRVRMRADMISTLSQQGWQVEDIEAVIDMLVEDGMHQVYKAWEEGRA